MLGGDINLSVTMTFFSSVAAFAMTSLWIYVLGSPLVSEDVPIPFLQLAIALVSFAVPVVLGVLARKVIDCNSYQTDLIKPTSHCCSGSRSSVRRSRAE